MSIQPKTYIDLMFDSPALTNLLNGNSATPDQLAEQIDSYFEVEARLDKITDGATYVHIYSLYDCEQYLWIAPAYAGSMCSDAYRTVGTFGIGKNSME